MSLYYNNYLFNCDLMYKQKSKSLYSISKLKSLDLTIIVSNFINELDAFALSKSTDIENQNKIFLLFYLNYFFLPYVKLIKKNDLIDFVIKLQFTKNFIIKFLYKNLNDIYYLIFNYLLQIKSNCKNSHILNLNFAQSIELRFYLKEVLGIVNIRNLNLQLYFSLKD